MIRRIGLKSCSATVAVRISQQTSGILPNGNQFVMDYWTERNVGADSCHRMTPC